MTALVDSGSEVTIMDETIAKVVFPNGYDQPQFKLVGANGSPIRILGVKTALIDLGPSTKFKHDIIIASGISSKFILGADLLRAQNLVLDLSNNKLRKASHDKRAINSAEVFIGKNTERKLRVITPFQDKDVLFIPNSRCPNLSPSLLRTDKTGRAYVVMQNGTHLDINLERGRCLGAVRLFDPSSISADTKWVTKQVSALQTERLELAKQVPLSHLPSPLRGKYLTLFESYVDVFSLNPNDIGQCKVLPQSIHLKDPSKISCVPPYRTPTHLQPVVHEYVQNLFEAGVIRKSTSPFCSPLLLVRKANASSTQPLVQQFRVVHDYRLLNENTVRDSYPLHNLYDLIDKVAASQVWSVIDLSSGFWNQTLDEKSAPYTAFAVPGMGHFEYTRSAQGLCNSPAAFQRLLDFVVRDIPNVFVYIDDIVLASPDHEQHLATLNQVLERFRKYNLKCRPHKLQIATGEINYLGYNLSHDKGIRPGLAKTKAVANWKAPCNVKEIRQFLGLCSFFRRTIRDFAAIASPLTKLTRKDSGWLGPDLPDKALASFNALKNKLVQRPCLQPPDFTKPFILTVDASQTGLGAVLSQFKPNGVEHPIAYASRVVKEAEQKQAPFHLEYTAMAWACRHFRPYLVGKRFKLRTDHKPLQTINKTKGAALERCMMELSEYDFEVEYMKGEKMPADGLSRQIHSTQLTDLQRYINFSWSQVREMQKHDPEIKALAIALMYDKVALAPALREFV